MKSALWSVCSMLNCENGFKFVAHLNEKHRLGRNIFEFVACLIKITEDHPILSVRATGYLCLNYLVKASTGANLVGKLGWNTFQPSASLNTKTLYS